MGSSVKNHLGSYHTLLEGFLRQGYDFVFFKEMDKAGSQLALRHDIDFDTHFALEAARTEAALGIKATYFFLLRSHFYNIFSPQDFENVLQIRELGHTVSIHFDPVIYEDFHEGLKREIAVFDACFATGVDIISLHRPNDFFLQFDAPIMGVEHTYQTKYFKEVKYFSDSTGVWRFGHPFESPEFAAKQSLHVLIHPVWWMVDGASNTDKLVAYYNQRKEFLKSEFFNNCVPFREVYASL
ncbi:MAG: hypothetical protein H6562_18885 [Lewinellaceae bacterium]|nr:hypothetical protein [Lewinella sp.]MCB9280962.1 hypothetical protein [Lewinellaceae bacterium]